MEKTLTFRDFKQEKIVEISRRFKSSWKSAKDHNDSLFKNTTITLSCSIKNGVFNTGLTVEEEKVLEDLLLLKPGELSAYSKYWNNWNYKFKGRSQKLNLENPIDYMNYKVLMAHPRVAQKEEEIREETDLIVFDREGEIVIKRKSLNDKAKAFKLYEGLSEDKINNCMVIITNGMTTSNIETNKVLLMEYLENSPVKFIDMVESIIFEDLALAYKLAKRNIIQKSGGYFFYAEHNLGTTFEECANYLKNPLNNDPKTEMMIKLEASK